MILKVQSHTLWSSPSERHCHIHTLWGDVPQSPAFAHDNPHTQFQWSIRPALTEHVMCQASVNSLPWTSSEIELRNYTTQTGTNLILVDSRRQYKRRCNPQLKQGKSISHHFLIIPPYSSVGTFYTILRHPFLKKKIYLWRQRCEKKRYPLSPGLALEWTDTVQKSLWQFSDNSIDTAALFCL